MAVLVVIRGAGDIATGIALRLYRAGMDVVMCETAHPTAIRRTVCFSEAVRLGETVVEGICAKKTTVSEVAQLINDRIIPVLVDETAECVSILKPDAVVDAILAKRNLGTRMDMAPVVVGVGPGFTVGVDCHAAVETMRGHTLGRTLYEGSPMENTAVPGLIGGFAGERVLRAPCDGIFRPVHEIGDKVSEGECVACVEGVPMVCTIGGVLRGLLPEGTPVHKGMKSGDVDPRAQVENCFTASDKAIAVGGGVLEAILRLSGVLRQ